MLRRGSGRSLFRVDLMVALAVACACAIPAAADAAFPGTDPTESPRANTPNDPDFDRCELDNDGGPGVPVLLQRGVPGIRLQSRLRLAGRGRQSTSPLPGLPPDAADGRRSSTKTARKPTRTPRAATRSGAATRSPASGSTPPGSTSRDRRRPARRPGRLDRDPRHGRPLAEPRPEEQDRAQSRRASDSAERHRGPPLEPGGAACAGIRSTQDDADGDGAFNVRDYRCDPQRRRRRGRRGVRRRSSTHPT